MAALQLLRNMALATGALGVAWTLPAAAATVQPKVAFADLPHATSDGLHVWPQEENGLVGVYRQGAYEVRFELRGPTGGCLADEQGRVLSGWGQDGAGVPYADFPQILREALVPADASMQTKAEALEQWCRARETTWRGFVEVMRALEFEPLDAQEALLGARLPVYRQLFVQAHNIDSLCRFAAAHGGQGPRAKDFLRDF